METFIFDLYGTLVDIRTDESSPRLWEKLAMFMAQHQARYDWQDLKKAYQQEVARALSDKSSLSQDAHEGNPEIDILLVFKQLYAAKGIKADEPLLRETARFFRILSCRYIRLYPYAKELLAALKAQGKKVILLSNAQEAFTRPELTALDIADSFDHIYISSEYGCKKPDPDFFWIALKEQNIDPAAAIMIGNDGTSDIAGAKGVGLHTFYIRSNISPNEKLPEADYVLDHMDLKKAADILLNL